MPYLYCFTCSIVSAVSVTVLQLDVLRKRLSVLVRAGLSTEFWRLQCQAEDVRCQKLTLTFNSKNGHGRKIGNGSVVVALLVCIVANRNKNKRKLIKISINVFAETQQNSKL